MHFPTVKNVGWEMTFLDRFSRLFIAKLRSDFIIIETCIYALTEFTVIIAAKVN